MVNNLPQSISIHLVLLLIFGYCADATSQHAGKWRIKNRLHASYEFDDNIQENTADSLKKIDSSLRFLFHSRASRSDANTRLIFSYQGGLQSYFQTSIENKLINEVHFSAHYKFNKFAAGIRGDGRLKLYLNNTFDYSTGSAELFFRPPSISNFVNEFGIKTAVLDYQNFPDFDYSDKQLKWTISKRLSSTLTGALELSGRVTNYNRRITSDDSTNFQKDRNYRLQFRLNYAKSFLINFNYSFQHNDSNSFLFDYDRHQFVLILGIPLPNKIWLRSYSTLQIKHYSEETITIPTDVDTEREESNFFVLDISRDMSPSLSALLRFAYYNNESILRSRFYRKVLITAGFDFRF